MPEYEYEEIPRRFEESELPRFKKLLEIREIENPKIPLHPQIKLPQGGPWDDVFNTPPDLQKYLVCRCPEACLVHLKVKTDE